MDSFNISNGTSSSKMTSASNNGVSCNVTNCVYHDGKCYCKAEKIDVGPTFANSSTDTVCSTFRAR